MPYTGKLADVNRIARMIREAVGTLLSRVVQRKSDGRYYAGDGVWTENPDTAKQFHSAMQVVQECANLEELSAETILTVCPEQGDLQLTVS